MVGKRVVGKRGYTHQQHHHHDHHHDQHDLHHPSEWLRTYSPQKEDDQSHFEGVICITIAPLLLLLSLHLLKDSIIVFKMPIRIKFILIVIPSGVVALVVLFLF